MNDEWRLMNSTLLHRNKQNWTVPHPNRLRRFPSEQRIRRSEKDKTHPFHSPTDGTVSHLNRELNVVTSKKTKHIRSTSMTAWMPPRRLQGGSKTEFRWLWIDLLFIFDWFLIDFALIVHWFLNDEWQMMNAEWTMMNAEWWMMNARERGQLSVGGHQPIPV